MTRTTTTHEKARRQAGARLAPPASAAATRHRAGPPLRSGSSSLSRFAGRRLPANIAVRCPSAPLIAVPHWRAPTWERTKFYYDALEAAGARYAIVKDDSLPAEATRPAPDRRRRRKPAPLRRETRPAHRQAEPEARRTRAAAADQALTAICRSSASAAATSFSTSLSAAPSSSTSRATATAGTTTAAPTGTRSRSTAPAASPTLRPRRRAPRQLPPPPGRHRRAPRPSTAPDRALRRWLRRSAWRAPTTAGSPASSGTPNAPKWGRTPDAIWRAFVGACS